MYQTKGVNMTNYTGSQLQSKIGEVLNAVQERGYVEIKNRTRPDMIIMTKEQFSKFIKANEIVGYASGQASVK